MNYIEQIRGFWRSHEENLFTTTEVAVYFYLLEVCNICQWKNPFKRNNAKIEADLSISFNTLKNTRNKLQQAGLITFKTANGSPNVLYTLSKFDKVTTEVGVKVANEVPAEVGAEVLPPKDKLNKTETKPKIIPPTPRGERVKKEVFDFSFVEEDFRQPFGDWLEYKAGRKERYKTQKSLEVCYHKLKNLSGENSENAKKIVEQSLANNWAGLFEVRSNGTTTNKPSSREGIAANIAADAARLDADFERRKATGGNS